MSRLGWVDFLAVVWVLAVLIWLGLRLRRQGGRGFSSFLLAGRRLPWWLLGTSMVATTFAADTPLGVSGLVGQQGIAGNWFWWSFLFGTTLTVSLFAGPWRRSRLATDVELIRLRYGGFFGGLLRAFRSLYMSFLFTGIILGWVLKAMALVLEVSLDLDASARSWVLAALVFLSLAYTLVSGLWGVVMTDFLQFVLAMAGSVTLALLVWDQSGGSQGLRLELARSFGEKKAGQMLAFLPVHAGELVELGGLIFAYYLAVHWWAVVYPGAEPGGGSYVAGRMLAARSEQDARRGTLLFAIAHYALRPWPWIIVGLWAATRYRLPEEDMGMGYPMAMAELLPPGLFGLVLASFFAAFMSTVDTHLHLASSYLVNDLYRPFLARKAGDRHSLWAMRVSLLLVLGASSYISYRLESVDQAWKLLAALGAGSGSVLILRWYWWRVTAFSELAAMVASLCFAILFDAEVRSLFPIPADWWPGALIHEEAPRLGAIVLCSTATWLAVTLLTPPVPLARLEGFYERIRPGGFWGPIARKRPDVQPDAGLDRDLLSWLLSTVLVFSAMFAIGKWIFADGLAASVLGGTGLLAGLLLWGNE